jgi:hypothetical protein
MGPEIRFVVTDKQITSQLGEESVILGLDDGIYYGLDSLGTRVWTLLSSPRSAREICEDIKLDYDVSATACEEAVLALLQDMESRALIERRG